MMQVLSPTIASLSHQYPMDDTTLRAARGEYGKRIDHLNNEVSLRQKNTQESGDE
ncbi:MAG: hypothetical protein H6766_06205 [Candidatus Peribacteria bacterium]|nr:MAG: hypothetical protein H6766_06205 [Candidatus Peribacteria bacterium]